MDTVQTNLRKVARVAAAAYLWAAAGAAQAQLGSPNDAFSCYSHCGETRSNAFGVTCYCDAWCETRGDCCADVDTYCAVEGSAPQCALTNNTPGDASEFGRFCGTDLGFMFSHGGAIQVLFGDSWQYPSGVTTTCEDRGVQPPFGPGENDDSQGTLPLTRPAWLPLSSSTPGASAVSCPAGTLTMNMTGSTFTPIALRNLSNVLLPLAVGDTPLTGFSDGTNAWGVFGDGGPTEADRNVYIAYRTSGTNYRARVDLGKGGNFQNPSAAVVTSLTNFDPPGSGGTLLLFGRPLFNLSSSSSAQNPVYLLRQTLPLNTTGVSNWAPQYYVRTNADGSVTWSSSASAALPIIATDFKSTAQLDVKWIPQIKKWVMLYGGSTPDVVGLNGTTTDQPRHGAIHIRLADFPWGPWTPPAPALFREEMGPYYDCDANGFTIPTGCDVWPWATGLWTQGYADASIPNCRVDAQLPWMPNYPWCPAPGFQQRGNLYSPNMIVPWTADNGLEPISRTRRAALYFATSTWSPYQVTLNILDLRMFEQLSYSWGATFVQLRDRNKGMIDRNSTTNTSRVAGSNASYAPARTKFFALWAGSGSPPERLPAIGDTVVFLNNFNGDKLLARNGSAISYLDDTFPYPSTALWVLESTNTATYPNGTPVIWGKTPFRIKAASSTHRLRTTSTGAISASTSTPDSTFVWNFLWSCVNGDSCVVAP
jgi:hypothetical protein